MLSSGVAKVRKEASFRERKLPFAKGRFWLRNEDFFLFCCARLKQTDHILINLDLFIIEMMILMFVNGNQSLIFLMFIILKAKVLEAKVFSSSEFHFIYTDDL